MRSVGERGFKQAIQAALGGMFLFTHSFVIKETQFAVLLQYPIICKS